MNLVLDASITLAWLFERQKKHEVELADLALSSLAEHEAFVPTLWHIEIANALLIGERRGVVTEAKVMDYLHRLSELPITTDDRQAISRRDVVMALAREHRLTAYDAIYLDLSLQNNAMLATFDSKLAQAMRRAGGIVFGDS